MCESNMCKSTTTSLFSIFNISQSLTASKTMSNISKIISHSRISLYACMQITKNYKMSVRQFVLVYFNSTLQHFRFQSLNASRNTSILSHIRESAFRQRDNYECLVCSKGFNAVLFEDFSLCLSHTIFLYRGHSSLKIIHSILNSVSFSRTL